MTKELTDEQIYGIKFSGSILSFARAIIAADRKQQDARWLEELRAYELTASNLRAEIAGFEAGCAEDSQIGIRMRQEMVDLKAECVRLKAELAGRGEVVVTRTDAGQIIAVTRQDVDGKILSVIAAAPQLEEQQEIAGRSVPDGWKLVPVVANAVQIMAASLAAKQYFNECGWNSPSVIYCAMLTAAPQPPAQQGSKPDDETVSLIKACRAAFSEELAAYDIDPPIHHLRQGHDDCSAWLAKHGIKETP